MGGFVGDVLGGVGLDDTVDAFTGQAGADAAREGARLQTQAAMRGIDVSDAAQRRLEETLAPFVSFGSDLALPRAQQLFGADAATAVLDSPILRAIQDDAEARILAGQAARGRLDTGETSELLQDAFLRSSMGLLGQERGDILNALSLGQSSAAQQGFSGVQNANRTSDILQNIGNVQAAGGIGAAQAESQGLQNLIGTGLTAATLFASERKNKRNITLTGIRSDGVRMYRYQYKWSDKWYTGSMVDENPHAVVDCGTYKALDYARL